MGLAIICHVTVQNYYGIINYIPCAMNYIPVTHLFYSNLFFFTTNCIKCQHLVYT